MFMQPAFREYDNGTYLSIFLRQLQTTLIVVTISILTVIPVIIRLPPVRIQLITSIVPPVVPGRLLVLLGTFLLFTVVLLLGVLMRGHRIPHHSTGRSFVAHLFRRIIVVRTLLAGGIAGIIYVRILAIPVAALEDQLAVGRFLHDLGFGGHQLETVVVVVVAFGRSGRAVSYRGGAGVFLEVEPAQRGLQAIQCVV
uniref:(northern house mosquito) hypothetical protein n=1 Tax=Culex pipiens TaxID=7175 RepID=A0A8D8CD13_CULPI